MGYSGVESEGLIHVCSVCLCLSLSHLSLSSLSFSLSCSLAPSPTHGSQTTSAISFPSFILCSVVNPHVQSAPHVHSVHLHRSFGHASAILLI